MPPSGQFTRGHLRLAPAPEGHAPSGRRAGLLARTAAVYLGLAWLAVAGYLAAVIALIPLLWRGAPLGRRLRPAEPHEARIISFQARRRALPR